MTCTTLRLCTLSRSQPPHIAAYLSNRCALPNDFWRVIKYTPAFIELNLPPSMLTLERLSSNYKSTQVPVKRNGKRYQNNECHRQRRLQCTSCTSCICCHPRRSLPLSHTRHYSLSITISVCLLCHVCACQPRHHTNTRAKSEPFVRKAVIIN